MINGEKKARETIDWQWQLADWAKTEKEKRGSVFREDYNKT